LPFKPAKKQKAHRKLRTRAHIIEELSINYFERYALLCGFSLEKVIHDYGYDLLLFTYSANGEIENGSVTIQMKASDNVVLNIKGNVVFDLDTRDLNLWLNQFDPVLLVVYEANTRKAYWLDIQKYFKTNVLSNKKKRQGAFRVFIPKNQIINIRSMRKFAKLKNDRYNIVNFFS
jgi:hypothetical protein